MKIAVAVKANAKQNHVDHLGERRYRVSVKAPPKEGRANEAVLKLLRDYFCVPRQSIAIVKGERAKDKVVIIHGR